MVRFWRLTVGCVVFGTAGLLAFAADAYATSTSGRIDVTEFGNSNANACVEAVMHDTADAISWDTSWYNYPCSNGENVPAGYMGTKADEYMNGSYCGTTGWAYNNLTSDDFGYGGVLCGNPSGLQSFYTVANSYWWYPAGREYLGDYTATSPNQSY